MFRGKTRREHKQEGSGDLKGNRRARPFDGIVPRDFGPKPWKACEPPGGEIPDGQNPAGPADNSTVGYSDARRQEPPTSSE